MPAVAESAPANGRRVARMLAGLAGVLVVAFALRMFVMERTFPLRPLGDEMYYVVVASNIAAGRGHVYGPDIRALRPPAHAWLLSRVTDAEAVMGEGAFVRSARQAPPRWSALRMGCSATSMRMR